MAKSDEQLKDKGALNEDKDKNLDKDKQPKGKGASDDKGDETKRLTGQITALQKKLEEKDTAISDLKKQMDNFTTVVAEGLGIKTKEGESLTLETLAKTVSSTANDLKSFRNETRLEKLLSSYDLPDKAKAYIRSHVDMEAEDLDASVKSEVEAIQGILGNGEDDGKPNGGSPFDRRPFSAGQMQPKTFDANADANAVLEGLKDKSE